MEEINYICNNCGECFKSRKKDRKYCSRKCQYGQWRKEAESKRVRICQWCNKEFVMRGLSGKAKRGEVTEGLFCSRKCRWDFVKHNNINGERCNVHFIICVVCGKLFTTRYNKPRCSKKCDIQYYQQKRTPHKLKTRACKNCQEIFIPKYRNKKRLFCSNKCLKLFNRRPTRYKSRAHYYNVAYEYINVLKVFERDGWRCRICGKKTPKEKRGKFYSNSPELDHRIPISKGGGHLYVNVQCCCRKCNNVKSNKNNKGQLPLFEIKSIR